MPTQRKHARTACRLLLVLAVTGLVVAGCGATTAENPDGTSGAAARPQILATTAILGDIASRIAGDAADVEVLVPAGDNPATYRPTPDDQQRLSDADLIISIGLGYEARSEEAIATAADEGVDVFEIGPELEPLPYEGSGADPENGEALDPYVWMDPHRMVGAVPILTDRFGQLSIPLADLDTLDRADEYADDIRTIQGDMDEILGEVDEPERVLVTEAEGLAYLADRFDFELIDIGNEGRIPGALLGTRELSRLQDAVDESGVNVLFIRELEGSSVADQVRERFDSEITVVSLWVDTLSGPDGPAANYLDLLRVDAELIAEALTGKDNTTTSAG